MVLYCIYFVQTSWSICEKFRLRAKEQFFFSSSKKYRRLWVNNRRKLLLKSYAQCLCFLNRNLSDRVIYICWKTEKTILTCRHKLEGTNRALRNFSSTTLNHKYSLWLSIIFRSFRQIRGEFHKNLPCPHTVSVMITKKNCISRGRIQIPVVFIKSPMIEIIIKDTLNPFTPKI